MYIYFATEINRDTVLLYHGIRAALKYKQPKMSNSGKDAGKEGSGKDAGVYQLMSGDNPGTLITQVQLRADNFDEWTMAIKTALRAKKKLGFIDGSVK